MHTIIARWNNEILRLGGEHGRDRGPEVGDAMKTRASCLRMAVRAVEKVRIIIHEGKEHRSRQRLG
jgi:hypothetical protein